MSKFEAGDKVRIKSSYFGSFNKKNYKIGKPLIIRKISNNICHFDGNNGRFGIYENDLELVENKKVENKKIEKKTANFKIGDKVRCTGEGIIYPIGYEFKVGKINRDIVDNVLYIPEGNNNYGVIEHNLELIKDKKGSGEIRMREIDWSKVPKFTKVQVRDRNISDWKNAYFIELIDNAKFQFGITMYSEHTFDGASPMPYSECRIHESVVIPKEWYKEDFEKKLIDSLREDQKKYCNGRKCGTCKYNDEGSCVRNYTVKNIDRIKEELKRDV